MTLHMFRCYIGPGSMSSSDLETRIDDWVSKNGEWTEDSEPHPLIQRTANVDGTGTTFWAIDVRFQTTDSKSNILQKFEDKLKDKVDWYRVGYHACKRIDGGDCTWDDITEWTAKDVTVPADVPSIN